MRVSIRVLRGLVQWAVGPFLLAVFVSWSIEVVASGLSAIPSFSESEILKEADPSLVTKREITSLLIHLNSKCSKQCRYSCC